MHAVTRRSLSVGHFFAIVPAVLFLFPTASRAQVDNTATGQYALLDNTTGSYNTADGANAVNNNTTGDRNTGIGVNALYGSYAGSDNTATGFYALYGNTRGNYNTANGVNALVYNGSGSYNTAIGYQALYYNTASYNTASGSGALYNNDTGGNNTATGYNALYSNTTGKHNTANGYGALYLNTTGVGNLAEGLSALSSNSSGSNNVALGADAGLNITGSSNIGLGYGAGENITTGSSNIIIGNSGTSTDSGITRIGTNGSQSEVFIAGINGKTASGGVEVYINSNGQLGTVKSSRRFKFDIKDLGATSEKLMDLRPVAFRYKEAAEDGTHPIQYGLIAEEVAKVYPDLVQYDKQGKAFTVYYHLLTPMMLNELQKAHQQLAAQQAEISALKLGQNQTAGLQTQVTSLQHANQLQFMILGGLVLVFAGYAMTGRKRRIPSWRARAIEGCA